MRKSILAISLICMSTMSYASNYCNNGCDDYENESSSGDATATATASADVNIDLTINNTAPASVVDENVNNYYVNNDIDDVITSNKFSSVVASMSAIANIPALQHVNDDHGHSGLGVGVGVYNNKVAMAVGVLHQYEVFSFKATVSKTDRTTAIWGAGATLSF